MTHRLHALVEYLFSLSGKLEVFLPGDRRLVPLISQVSLTPIFCFSMSFSGSLPCLLQFLKNY